MFPIVAHVVGIEELTNAAAEQGTELGVFGGKQAVIVPVGIEHAVMPFLRLELPEVVIEPAHRALDDIMEHFEAGIDGHLDAAPAGGLQVFERDANPGDLVGHAAMLDRKSTRLNSSP